jgi:hypothetical protein
MNTSSSSFSSASATVDNVMSMKRSISLQFSLSLTNLASSSASTTNGNSNNASTGSCCNNNFKSSSASQFALLPKRKSFQIPKALSTMTLLDLNGGSGSSSSNGNEMTTMMGVQRARSSPVTNTFDYLAKSMRFPDVSIGLSI